MKKRRVWIALVQLKNANGVTIILRGLKAGLDAS
jgi:hypothetical protein